MDDKKLAEQYSDLLAKYTLLTARVADLEEEINDLDQAIGYETNRGNELLEENARLTARVVELVGANEDLLSVAYDADSERDILRSKLEAAKKEIAELQADVKWLSKLATDTPKDEQ